MRSSYFRKSVCLYLWIVCTISLISGETVWIEPDETTVECSFDRIVVKGVNISIQEVLDENEDCMNEAKFIEIFSLNVLNIDADINKTGQSAQISFIAPTWIVDGERKIILDGEPGEPHLSLTAFGGSGEFRHGKPGKPGGSAGCFFGIANEIIDGMNLEIHLNGGDGGPGQNGGRGWNFQSYFLNKSFLPSNEFLCE